ncbi:Electron transport complex subunit RsxB [Candidatus Thermoflexus japonica]|uniref:Electron transport complex subunit RsxB n=1 Tax=Candidatus Thermoflexus japonica TaxID=2035417 RepID=A0A2H5Y7E0_9CHLR|nr:Electron transport complex subunit RsxB [Candidatus Thermoflexus japonica]
MLQLSWLFYEGVPGVERERCAAEQGCQVCQRVCPYGAWRWVDGYPELDKETCQTCGLCVVSCPRGAIVNPRWTPEQLEGEIQTLLDPRIGDLRPRGLVFQCQRAEVAPLRAHPSWLKVTVPCVGMLPPSWLLAPLVLGAGAVQVFSCPQGCTHHLEERGAGTVRFCQRVLAQLGLPEDRIRSGRDLLQPPPESMGRIEVWGLFLPQEPARVFQLLAELCSRTELSLTDPLAPLGQIHIDPDVCTGCARCAQVCPAGALGLEEEADRRRWTFDAGRCVACEECLLACPEHARGAIQIVRAVDLQVWRRGQVPIHEAKIVRCIRCGQPITAATLLDWIENRLRGESPELIRYLRQYCATCRQAFVSAGGHW